MIKNNYCVVKYFDNHEDGLASKKFLTKDEAERIKKSFKEQPYISFGVVEHLSIVGIIPFNHRFAYIFNKKLPVHEGDDCITITSETYEELMNCYVFTSYKISKSLLQNLINEYHERGGVTYSKYHDFENNVLKEDRKNRQLLFKGEIVKSFESHGLKQESENTWIGLGIVVTRTQSNRRNAKYDTAKNHLGLDIDLGRKILLGSIFGLFVQEISQLSNSDFTVVCNKKESYHFNCFNVSFL